MQLTTLYLLPTSLYLIIYISYFAGGEHTPSRGTETCSVVEMMNSMRIAYETTGNVSFMDRYFILTAYYLLLLTTYYLQRLLHGQVLYTYYLLPTTDY